MGALVFATGSDARDGVFVSGDFLAVLVAALLASGQQDLGRLAVDAGIDPAAGVRFVGRRLRRRNSLRRSPFVREARRHSRRRRARNSATSPTAKPHATASSARNGLQSSRFFKQVI